MAKSLDTTGGGGLSVRDKSAELELLFQNAGFRVQAQDEEGALSAALDIALRIAQAETIEEVLDPGQTYSGRDLIGKRFRIVGPVSLRESTYSGGVGFYMQFTANVTDPQTGEITTEVVSIGALNPMVQLARAAQLGEMDRDWRMVESAATTRGYTALWLADA